MPETQLTSRQRTSGLRREWIGRREGPSVRGVSRVRVVPVLRPAFLSAIAGYQPAVAVESFGKYYLH